MVHLWICWGFIIGLRGVAVTMLESDLGPGHRHRRDKNVIQRVNIPPLAVTDWLLKKTGLGGVEGSSGWH